MTTLPLLKRNISLDEALEHDDNVLHMLDYPQKLREFKTRLISHKADIEATVAFHLQANCCQLADEDHWMMGNYNICIPVCVNPPSENNVLIRIPLPFKVGEEKNPGNVDEKLRCEVATYIWIHQNCPTVPIPCLYGFGFPDGQTFVRPSSASLSSRLRWRIARTLRSWLGYPTSCPYISLKRPTPLGTGYMIISLIDKGRQLSEYSLEVLLGDKTRRQTLFSDLARIILTLNRTEFPRIGSLTLNNAGVVRLTNRPLTLRLHTLENEGIPTIPRDSVYQAVESYLLDLLQCHDNRIYHQPNAIHDTEDGQEQLAALTMMRALLPQFISREYRHGPFRLTLTDLQPGNIFVNEEWHITGIIDLEFAAVLPVELQTPVHWLTGRTIDDIEPGEHLDAFEIRINEYIAAFEELERKDQCSDFSHAQIMRSCWNRRSFWYIQAVHSPKGLLQVFREHIQRYYCEEHCRKRVFDETVSPYWCEGVESLIQRKVEEEARYKNQLKERFGQGRQIAPW
ncbi:uncharacterized protein NFIA_044130 [Aspergillus fischeri NRRL 181]|uniref:Aminoglycoside phosphotransferase domain-containing protein n=1 Tax=Neosartorya fischeri (strain ATCC 1020 / DSM 3700 / CBS 544.65 / FGSC A1164 / JCM 1740 / NRRL 181 / WB 181) TaxID=331117 RepID=A1CV17_NEOFI|nr:conserved hypothetical protein [Aspergillus fischeri NRRL 181]EAW25594.1 conserved hypothetical protein [Aspergillus fischeri NRRL 181]KAG2002745.1 hypothetical protein GB937_009510 [Aspergillus fischeri]